MRGTSPNHPSYTRPRMLLDAFALLDIFALAAAESRAFPQGGTPLRLYSLAVLALLTAFWLVIRRHEYPVWAIVALQLSVVGHVAGRFVVLDDLPLYRAHLLGIPGDKVIHAFNSAAGAVFVTALFRRLGLVLKGWEGFIVLMVVSGAGALVEIVEYGGTLVLPMTHVGDYANNMQDLIANLLGALAGWVLAHLIMRDGADRTSDAES